MLDNSVHFSVAGSQSSAENTAWVSSLKPVPLVPPVISTLPSGSTVPVTCRRGRFIDAVKRHAGEAALISITTAVPVGGEAPPAFVNVPRAKNSARPQSPEANLVDSPVLP